MMFARCIAFSPSPLAVTANANLLLFCSRANNDHLSKRIIALAPDFVHAVIRIGSLDFQIELNETTANERPEGI